MKVIIITILVFHLSPLFLVAQTNLVLNSKFEDNYSCPNSGSLNFVPDWYASFGSVDYFTYCTSFVPLQVPSNYAGYQIPYSDSAYIGLATFLRNGNLFNNFREFATGKFSSELINNQKYCVNFHINLSDSSNYAISGFGCNITNDSIPPGGPLNPILSIVPTYKHPTFISNKDTWEEISFEFIANGGEKYITFGLFESDSLIDTLKISNHWNNGQNMSYYYIDDVSVILCENDSLSIAIPNVFTPNGDEQNDVFAIDIYGFENLKSINAQVFNRWGAKMVDNEWTVTDDVKSTSSTTQYMIWDGRTTATAKAPPGTYYYIITYTNKDDESYTEKGYVTLF